VTPFMVVVRSRLVSEALSMKRLAKVWQAVEG
jgi:hypothetical protein